MFEDEIDGLEEDASGAMGKARASPKQDFRLQSVRNYEVESALHYNNSTKAKFMLCFFARTGYLNVLFLESFCGVVNNRTLGLWGSAIAV